MKRRFKTIGVLAAVAALAAASPRHIELVASMPAADAVLSSAPRELLLTFSADLDFERSAATLRSPRGTPVKLGKLQTTGDPRQMKLALEEELPPGRYTVSWTAAPKDDHGGRGRFTFEMGAGH